jgi:hypothetical protein
MARVHADRADEPAPAEVKVGEAALGDTASRNDYVAWVQPANRLKVVLVLVGPKPEGIEIGVKVANQVPRSCGTVLQSMVVMLDANPLTKEWMEMLGNIADCKDIGSASPRVFVHHYTGPAIETSHRGQLSIRLETDPDHDLVANHHVARAQAKL